MKQVLFTLLVSCMFLTTTSYAQVTRYMMNGNDYYTKGKYKEAAETYSRALAKNPNYTPGLFNLGNSLYGLKKYDSSRKVMEMTEKVAGNKEGKAAANYNIGNSYMAERKWDDAINAYKKTLRNNPADADAKYNLSYAEKMKQQEQQQQKQDKKDNKKDDKKDNKDQQNKDKKDDKDNKEKKDDQNKEDQNKDNKDNQQQQPQQQKANISKQTAEQLLNALQNEEKKLQDKMRKEKGVPVRPDKDW